MSESVLPDIERTTCTTVAFGLDERCGAPVRLTDVTSVPELRLTIICVMGHEVSGTVSELFQPEDLALPALFAIEMAEFLELAQIVERHRLYVASASAAGTVPDADSYDMELCEWAAGLHDPMVLPFEVWRYVREHWDAIDKPDYPDQANFKSWVPDNFDPRDWV